MLSSDLRTSRSASSSLPPAISAHQPCREGAASTGRDSVRKVCVKKGPDVFLEGRAHHNSRCKFSHHGVTRSSVVMAAEAADEAGSRACPGGAS